MYPVDTAPNGENQAPARPKSPRKMRHGVTPYSAPPLVPKIADYPKTLPPQYSEVEPSQRLKRGFFDFQRRPAVALVYTLDSHHNGEPSLPASRPGLVKTAWDGSGTGGVALTRRHSARSEESGRSGRFEAGPNLSSSGREAATGNNAVAGRGQSPSPLEAIEKLLTEPLPNRIAITPHARIARTSNGCPRQCERFPWRCKAAVIGGGRYRTSKHRRRDDGRADHCGMRKIYTAIAATVSRISDPIKKKVIQ